MGIADALRVAVWHVKEKVFVGCFTVRGACHLISILHFKGEEEEFGVVEEEVLDGILGEVGNME